MEKYESRLKYYMEKQKLIDHKIDKYAYKISQLGGSTFEIGILDDQRRAITMITDKYHKKLKELDDAYDTKLDELSKKLNQTPNITEQVEITKEISRLGDQLDRDKYIINLEMSKEKHRVYKENGKKFVETINKSDDETARNQTKEMVKN